MKYAGIDGCRAGWVVAIWEKDQMVMEVVEKLQDLNTFNLAKGYIDIPLKFARQQYRDCELKARRLLGRQKNASVFLTPHQEAVYANSFAAANQINKVLIGKGVSVQAWNIFGKIKEAVAFSAAGDNLSLQEAHPELCFCFLNNGVPLYSKKSTPRGIAERMKIIETVSPACLPAIDGALTKTKRKEVKPDDILDAAVLAIRAAASNPQSVLPGNKAEECGNIFY